MASPSSPPPPHTLPVNKTRLLADDVPPRLRTLVTIHFRFQTVGFNGHNKAINSPWTFSPLEFFFTRSWGKRCEGREEKGGGGGRGRDKCLCIASENERETQNLCYFIWETQKWVRGNWRYDLLQLPSPSFFVSRIEVEKIGWLCDRCSWGTEKFVRGEFGWCKIAPTGGGVTNTPGNKYTSFWYLIIFLPFLYLSIVKFLWVS